MRLIGQATLFLLALASGFGLGILASAWVAGDWPTDLNDTATGIG